MWANASTYLPHIKASEVNLYPLIYTDDDNSKVLAYFLDSKKPALTSKEQDGYTLIYCGSKYLSCDVIKEIARFDGCHIYSETDDVIYANRSYITIHAAASGQKVIKFPSRCNVYEVYEEKNYGEGVDKIEFELSKGENMMFRISYQSEWRNEKVVVV